MSPHPVADCVEVLRAFPNKRGSYGLSTYLTPDADGVYLFRIQRRTSRTAPVELIGRLEPRGEQTRIVITQRATSARSWLWFILFAMIIPPLSVISGGTVPVACASTLGGVMLVSTVMVIGAAFHLEQAAIALKSALEKKILD